MYHKNAFRLQDAKLAKPFKIIINPWTVRDSDLLATAKVDPNKVLP